MKKTLFVLLAICGLAFTLTGCSSNSPKAVVEDFLEAAKKGDSEKFVELICMDEVLEDAGYDSMEEFKKEDPKQYRQMMKLVRSAFKEMPKEVKKAKFKVVDEEIDGDEATVTVEATLDGETDESEIRVIKDKEGNWKLDPESFDFM